MDFEHLEISKMKADFNPDLAAQIQEMQQNKVTVKTSYVFVKGMKQFLNSIYMEPSDWMTKEEAVKELETATSELTEIKTEMKSVKESIQSLCESAEEGYNLLSQKQSLLEEKKKELEKKKSELAEYRSRYLQSGENGGKKYTIQDMVANLNTKIEFVEESIVRCNEAMTKARSELEEMEPAIKTLEKTVAQNSHFLDKMAANQDQKKTVLADFTQTLKRLVGQIEELGGVTVVPLSRTALRVEFPVSSNDTSGIQLALSLEYIENNLGALILKSAQVNVESIDATEILSKAVADNDVPTLVTRLKSRWLSHQPLVSEISQLRLRSAVDWIQEESLLRVMVGKGGSIVCTLVVPPSYPLSGEVTLTDIKGSADIEDISEIKPRGIEKTLTSWVECLETKFGRP